MQPWPLFAGLNHGMSQVLGAAVLGLCPPGYRVYDNQCCSVAERRRRGTGGTGGRFIYVPGVKYCPEGYDVRGLLSA